jgi:hypothetical protein
LGDIVVLELIQECLIASIFDLDFERNNTLGSVPILGAVHLGFLEASAVSGSSRKAAFS